MHLRFGRLEDIILTRKEELRMLKAKYDLLLIKQCDNVEGCELRLAGVSCDECILKDRCRKDSAKISVMLDAIEKEMEKVILNLKYLGLELLISRNKEVYLKHIGLELFPNG
ncbi:MAG: hypothetical protein M1155_02040 [Patescibacteria group bacterium]|nr:hypothetical protein [Patescibacteria group bacterium]